MPPLKPSEDIQPLTTFRNNSAKMLKKLQRTKRPVILTVNGKPAAVLQSVSEYERFMDLEDEADLKEAIKEAEDDVLHGRTVPADKFFAEMRKKYKIAG